MKRTLVIILCIGISIFSKAQNSFPATGNVGIGTSTPGSALEVIGLAQFRQGMVAEPSLSSPYFSGYFRALANKNANVILQGGWDGSGAYAAYWLTGSNGLLKIGGIGGTEPSSGAINITSAGKVGIGTTSPGSFQLAVEGKIGAREVQVTTAAPWPDYVFKKTYKLITIDSLNNYLKTFGHLPNIPSAEEVEAKGGIELGDMNRRLLEKVEELTLYMIELNKKMAAQSKTIEELKLQVAEK